MIQPRSNKLPKLSSDIPPSPYKNVPVPVGLQGWSGEGIWMEWPRGLKPGTTGPSWRAGQPVSLWAETALPPPASDCPLVSDDTNVLYRCRSISYNIVACVCWTPKIWRVTLRILILLHYPSNSSFSLDIVRVDIFGWWEYGNSLLCLCVKLGFSTYMYYGHI